MFRLNRGRPRTLRTPPPPPRGQTCVCPITDWTVCVQVQQVLDQFWWSSGLFWSALTLISRQWTSKSRHPRQSSLSFNKIIFKMFVFLHCVLDGFAFYLYFTPVCVSLETRQKHELSSVSVAPLSHSNWCPAVTNSNGPITEENHRSRKVTCFSDWL